AVEDDAVATDIRASLHVVHPRTRHHVDIAVVRHDCGVGESLELQAVQDHATGVNVERRGRPVTKSCEARGVNDRRICRRGFSGDDQTPLILYDSGQVAQRVLLGGADVPVPEGDDLQTGLQVLDGEWHSGVPYDD